MNEKKIIQKLQKIVEQLADHETRISTFESQGVHLVESVNSGSGKQKTLREIVKGRKFKNGQQQIAIIVGYYENILGTLIRKDNIKTEWINTKMTNKYSKNFLDRAKDEFIRVHPNETCDLTQTGEEFFKEFLKNEPTKSTSK